VGSLDGDVVPAPQLDSISLGYSGPFPIRRFMEPISDYNDGHLWFYFR
jgi:hypothetical protein